MTEPSTPPARALADALAACAGADAVRIRMAREAEEIFVEPEHADAAAAVLAFCCDNMVRVRLAGAGTCLPGWGRDDLSPAPSVGAGPAAPVVVSARRMAAVTEYEPADLVAGAGAGMELSALQEALARNGQELPLDPAGGGTLGAAISLNAAGPLRAGHGTPRDMVLGVDMVTGDGRRLRFGGRVVKNVAGYDIVRLLVGSRGTLGLITAAWVRIRALPRHDRTMLLPAGSAGEAATLAIAVRDVLDADALEVLSPDGNGGGHDGWNVAVRVRGGAAAVDDATARIQRLDPRATAADPSFWQQLSGAEGDACFHLRLYAPVSELADALAAAERFRGELAAAGGGAGWTGTGRVLAHAADGVVRVMLPGAGSAGAAGDVAAAVSALEEEMTTRCWTWRYEVAAAALGGVPLRSSAPGEIATLLMERIRRTFDPAGILSAAAPAEVSK
jgi:glycolate oxidase FAD binding subunit